MLPSLYHNPIVIIYEATDYVVYLNIMEQKTIKVSKKKLIWAIIILIVIGIWWANRSPRYYDIMPMAGFGSSDSVSSLPAMEKGESRDMMYSPDYYPYPNQGNPDITDTRQFLKTSYGAEIKTRDVKDMTRDVKSIVTEAGGRIDNANESEKYSYFSFVVPKSKFESFRDEVESLTHEKLITINVSQENLLGQKQSIEEQMNSATSSLADLEKQKTNLTAKYNQTLAGLNSQLIALQNQGTSTDAQQAVIRQSIENEKRSYNSQLANLNNRIDSTKKWVENVEKQDTKFDNNIETVNGSISINWVSFWEIAKIFSPIHPTWIILILAIIAWKVLNRYGITPKIELV